MTLASTRSHLTSARQVREFKTISAMLRLYCRAHHAPRQTALCPDCKALHDYAERRLERCVFGEAKPTCAKCTVHCYKSGRREQIRQVMVWAGPRMLWRHPVLAVWHLMEGRRPAPALTKGRAIRRHGEPDPAGRDQERADPPG